MSVIDFVTSDIGKARRKTGLDVGWSLVLLLLPAIAGVGLRRDTVGLFSAPILISSVLMACVVAAFPWLLSTARLSAAHRRFALSMALLAVVMWSCWRAGFPWGTAYATWREFWIETETCFVKGLVTGLGMSALSLLITHRYYPLPTRVPRFFLASLGGLCGVIMLNLHCPSSHVGHLALGHWLQAVLIWTASYALQSWLFRARMRAALGESARSVERLDKLGG